MRRYMDQKNKRFMLMVDIEGANLLLKMIPSIMLHEVEPIRVTDLETHDLIGVKRESVSDPALP